LALAEVNEMSIWEPKASVLTDSVGDILECEMYLMTLLVIKRTCCRKQMDKHTYRT
jgi:hypothetical protein